MNALLQLNNILFCQSHLHCNNDDDDDDVDDGETLYFIFYLFKLAYFEE